ncbi:hypothetical protein LDO32_15250, partial [Luteimonas sp. Y-2-2-4F]|nr:hypothetical protein [Luteimonas sp. Y-2-2-4F]
MRAPDDAMQRNGNGRPAGSPGLRRSTAILVGMACAAAACAPARPPEAASPRLAQPPASRDDASPPPAAPPGAGGGSAGAPPRPGRAGEPVPGTQVQLPG